jgi:L-ribulose-5-phosphate 3-epimerase
MYAALHSYSFRDAVTKDPSLDIFRILESTASMGFRAIEVMSGKANCPPDHIGPEDITHLKKVMKRAKELGIQIYSFSTYNDFAYVKDETWRLANIAFIKRWLQFASDLGVPNIRMLTGYYVEGEDRARLEKLVVDGITECIPVAEKAGVNMAIENHSSVIMSADDIVGLIKKLGSKRLTTCPDPTNWCYKFFKPDCPAQDKEIVYQSAAKVAPLATAAHLKLKGVTDDGRLEGWDLDRLLNIYAKAGYAGPIAFESIADGDLLAPLSKAREVLEKAIAKVTKKGKA